MKNHKKTLSILITLTTLICLMLTPLHAQTFKTLSSKDTDIINYIEKKGLMVGTAPGEFSPHQAFTRAQFIVILKRMSNENVQTRPIFKDVATDKWYANAVTWAHDKNIIAGMSPTTFEPNSVLTHEQTLILLERYREKYTPNIIPPQTKASLNHVSPWAKNTVSKIVGIVEDANLINGKDNVTRLSAAKYFYYFDTKIINKLNNPEEPLKTNVEKPQQNNNPSQDKKTTYKKGIKTSWTEELNRSFTPTDEQKLFLKLMNDARRKIGVHELKYIAVMDDMAKIRADEVYQIAHNLEGPARSALNPHQRPNGDSIQTLVTDMNKSHLNIGLYENVARRYSSGGYYSVEKAFEGFMNSEGHRRTILSKDVHYVGINKCIGQGMTTWVQVFTGLPK